MVPLVLASSSPRRADLLRQLGLSFSVCKPQVDETVLPGEAPVAFVKRLAIEKADAIIQKVDADRVDSVVVAADTVVVIDDLILGKPISRSVAVRMLQQLSGRTHVVTTGVSVVGAKQRNVFAVETKVTFRTLNRDDMEKYWCSGEPCDKAGAYGIQGLGAVFVERIDGSYSNVVGLPLMETARALTDQGIDCLVDNSLNG
jgi:septum formation protein